jgi:GTP pyrophosphokinase
VSNIKLRGSKDEEFVENLRKMFLAMAKDLRVVFIKLADRYHNMQTLYALPEIKQKRIARETLEVFAPLAERLGMGELKGQLEDLAFPYVYPMEFEKVKRESVDHFKEAEKHIMKMRRNLLKKLAEEGVRDSVNARKKHLYSLWKKLERSGINWDFNRVHDIIALRILVERMSDCYLALGVVHKAYKPVPGLGVSDFIAQPKPNGYQSIHTKVFGPGGRIVEVQIRSYEMHDQAEHGLAAHWAYAELKGSEKIKEEKLDKKGIVIPKNKLNWVKQLVDWQKEIKDSKEYIQAVKFDALSHRIFVFSPKGDVYDLPNGATPVDFAFAVHTGLGRFIKSAIVNGKIVPLDYKLQSGDVVEILKSKNPKEPTASWLDFVATTTAKHQISSYLRSKDEKI